MSSQSSKDSSKTPTSSQPEKRKSPQISSNNSSQPPAKKFRLENFFFPKQKFEQEKEQKENSSKEEEKLTEIILTRGGISHTIFPSSSDDLHTKASELFKIPVDKIEFRNLKSEAISFENLTLTQNILVFSKDENGILSTDQDFIVDITPSKNILLKAGTSEYDVPSAIAEIIDNSIQAVRDNKKERKITIRLNKPKDGFRLFIWDNGKGMTPEELKNWATMGLSQSDSTDVKKSNSNTFSDRGYISRFGVGAKKAAFFLGKTITVTTRVSGSQWVYFTTLSQDSLNENGNEWKTTVTLRNPFEKEIQTESFTLVCINHLNFQFEDYNAGVQNLQTTLAHIYYYYLNPLSSQDGETSPPYEIKVNGIHLKEFQSNQKLYLAHGKNQKDFDFYVPLDSNKRSLVKLRLYYYPFRDNKETLPVPLELPDQDDVPLLLRKPGIDVFWNERLIKEAHIPLLNGFGFTKPGVIEKQKLEEKWFNRVKGFLFINSDFPVTHNKMHILKDDTAFTALTKFKDSNIEKEFRKWLLDSHIKLDMEFVFLEKQFNEKKNITECQAFSRGIETFTKGNYIQVRIKKTTYVGKLSRIWFSGSPEKKETEGMIAFVPYSHKELSPAEAPVHKIKSKLSPEEFENYVADQKSKLPGKLKLFSGDNVDYPTNSLLVGESFKWITVAVYDRKGRNIDKSISDSERIAISLTIIHEDTKEVKYSFETETAYKTGKYSFKDLKVFEACGTYKLIFECKYPDVEPIIHTVTVRAEKPEKLIATFANSVTGPTVEMDISLPPISVHQCDKFDNFVPFTSIPEDLSIECKFEQESSSSNKSKSSKSKKGSKKKEKGKGEEQSQSQIGLEQKSEQEIINLNNDPFIVLSTPKITLEDGNLIITNLIPGSVPLPSSSGRAILCFKHNGLESCTLPIFLTSGQPTSFTFSEGSPFLEEKPSFQNKVSLPSFEIILKDKCGNLVPHFNKKCVVEITSESFKRTAFTVSVIKGIATVVDDQIKILHRSENEEGSVTFTLKGKDVSYFSLTKAFIVQPSHEPSKLNLVPDDSVSIESYQPLVLVAEGGQLLNLKFQVLNESLQELTVSGKLATDFSDSEITVTNEKVLSLPPIQLEYSAKKYSYSIHFTPENGKKIGLKFYVRVSSGKPTQFHIGFSTPSPKHLKSGQKYFLLIRFQDAHGNVISSNTIPKEGYKELVSSLQPKVTLEAPDSPTNLFSTSQLLSCEFASDKATEEIPYIAQISCAGSGPITLVVSDLTGKIHSAKLQIQLLPSVAKALRVNCNQKISLVAKQGEVLDDLTISVVDEFGNVTKTNNVSLTLRSNRQPPFQFKNVMNINDGNLVLKQQQVSLDASGEYLLEIASTSMKLESCFIKLIIKRDPKEPSKIVFHNYPEIGQAGEDICDISISVHSEEGCLTEEVIPKSSLKLIIDSCTVPCIRYDSPNNLFYFASFSAPTSVGRYILKACLQGPSQLVQEAEFNVTPGEPAKLETNPRDITLPQISNNDTLVKQLAVEAVDQFENSCDCAGIVKVSVVSYDLNQRNSSNEQNTSCPTLTGTLEYPLRYGKATFKNLKLEDPTPKKSGVYYLKFDLFLDSHNLSSIQSKYLEFFYQNQNEVLQDKAKLDKKSVELNQLLKKKKSDFDNLQKEKKQKVQNQDKLLDRQNSVINRLENLFNSNDRTGPALVTQISSMSSKDLICVIEKYRKDMNELQNFPRRERQMQLNKTIEEILNFQASQGSQESGVIGIVAELAFVDNEQEAKVFAKLLGNKFHTIILRDQMTFDKIYAKYRNSPSPVTLVQLESLVPFTMKRKDAQNTTEEGIFLPLEPRIQPKSGFLGYAVNRIELKNKHEFLRKTLFWNLFRDTMVFKTLKEAQTYQTEAAKQRIQVPKLLVVEENEIVEAGGFIQIGEKKQSNLCFGQLPIQETQRFHHFKNIIPCIEELKQIKEKFEELTKQNEPEMKSLDLQIQKIQEECKELQKQIQILQNEIQNLNSGKKGESSSSSSTHNQKKSKKRKEIEEDGMNQEKENDESTSKNSKKTKHK